MGQNYTVACYYFPNYHADPRNAAQHGPGWTEWELVKRAEPRFPGHLQPNVPAWGYEDESDPEVMARKIGAAADHGIGAFIFDWYYYDDGPFLERGIEKGLFGAANRDRIRFGVMWANHDWTDIHPAKRNCTPPLLYPGRVSSATFNRITDHLVEQYFKHPSYWLIEGRPYFSVYDLSKLMESFGSVAATREALDTFRAKTKAAGFPDLHLNAVVWGRTVLPREEKVAGVEEIVKRLGFDSVTSYTWVHHVAMPEFPETQHAFMMDKYYEFAAKALDRYDGIPYYPNITMGWDSSPRVCQSDVLDRAEYPSSPTMVGNTPEAFRESLRRAKDLLAPRPAADRIVTINCWNEWTEGSYLEPDKRHGMAYLQAVREVFGASAPAPQPAIAR